MVPAGQQQQLAATFYAGPKVQDNLKHLAPGLELTVDYGWLWFIGQLLFWLLKAIHGLVGNWGWAIVGLTLTVKIAFLPAFRQKLQIDGQHAPCDAGTAAHQGTVWR
jgi:YidC/Oxa1 family membrane protein insertase